MARQKREFTAISPEGEITRESGITEFAARHGLSSQAISTCLGGRQESHKGWRFRDQADVDPPSAEPEAVKADDGVGDVSGLTRKQRIDRAMTMRENLIAKHARILSGESEMPVGWNPDRMMKPIESELKACGVDLERAADDRSPEERAADAIEKLVSVPESMFSMADEDLAAIETAMNRALDDGELYVEEMIEKKAGMSPGKAKAVRVWLSRLRRLRKVRSWITTDRINEYWRWSQPRKLAWDATRVLRYQVYVGRSDASDAGAGGSSKIFQFGRPHVKMAVDLYRAWHKIAITPEGVLRPGDTIESTGRQFPGLPYQGCMALYPPRHGKSAFLRHVVGLTMGVNPSWQGAYVHARTDEASRFIKYVSEFFNPESGPGARHLSMFPAELTDYDNNAKKIRLRIPEPTSNPTFMGAGVWDQALGINLDYIIFDDVVPQEDMTQETERKRRVQRVSGTWLSRLQSRDSIFILAGYPWHNDDVLCQMRRDAKRARDTNGREGRTILVSAMATGGPSSSTKFRSIWPDVWPSSRLRQRYSLLADASIWAANFMLTPLTDEHRIVKKVRYYDPNDETHAKFIEAAQVHLSIDPVITDKDYSDLAGMITVAAGDILTSTVDEFGFEDRTYKPVIRVMECSEFKSTQSELAETVAFKAAGRRTDQLHIEVKGGGYAVIEFLEKIHGIDGVIRHNPGIRSKEQRLREVASMLEASGQENFCVVEFMGERGDDNIIRQHPSMKKIVDYVVNFRATSGHHGLDALTQVLRHLQHMIGPGQGAVTVQARREKPLSRRQQHLRQRSNALATEKQGKMPVELLHSFAGGFGA